MKVLVIGSGGREHSLVWKIHQSPKVDRIYAAPGNGGISELAECVDIKANDLSGLLNFAKAQPIDLTIVGPEAPLVKGIVDLFQKEGLKIFGPRKDAAILEGSKVFAKELMAKYDIPTAKFKVFQRADEAKDYVRDFGAPIVIKADGLAAGKGAIVASTVDEATVAIKSIMEDKVCGSAGDRVIVEECLEGEEASIIVFTDGEAIIPLVSSQDHKRIFDGDRGPNTGGMGAYSPAPVITEDLNRNILKKIVLPTIKGMEKEGRPFKGILYVGIMVTREGPKVMEFNVRFGDPENQAIMPRLKTDLVELMEATIEGGLNEANPDWDQRPCICVVIASGGYPGSYQRGKKISGLDSTKQMKDVVIFHAGTAKKDGEIVTNGGRVLGVTALGKDIKEAQAMAYEAIEKIHFENMYYRRDIGYRAIGRSKQI